MSAALAPGDAADARSSAAEIDMPLPAPLRRWLGRHARAQGEESRAGGLAALLAETGATGIGDVYRNRISRWRDPAADRMTVGCRQLCTANSRAMRRSMLKG